MNFEFESTLIEWRGPAPFIFAPIPQSMSDEIKVFAKKASYGWGCISVSAQIGETDFTTAIIPKDGVYLVPVKVAVQKAQGISVGDTVRLMVRV